MRLEPTLNVTPEGLLTDIPTVMRREMGEQAPNRETLGMFSETAYMDFPNTQVKTIPKESERSTTLHGTKETSQAEVLASTRQFFANVPAGDQRTSTEIYVRDNTEIMGVPTTINVTTTVSTPTPPTIVYTALRGTDSP